MMSIPKTRREQVVNARATIEVAELLLLPESVEVQAVCLSSIHLTIRLSTTSKSACCPQCQALSQRIHSRYGRTLANLPCAGRRVVLKVTVCKFVCNTATCSCRIFDSTAPQTDVALCTYDEPAAHRLAGTGTGHQWRSGACVAE